MWHGEPPFQNKLQNNAVIIIFVIQRCQANFQVNVPMEAALK